MNGFDAQRFQDDLAEIADISTGVEMHDRVLAGSRRLARRRALTFTSLTAAAVLGVAGTAFALVPHDGAGINPPADPPGVSASESPEPSPTPDASGSATPSGGPAAATSAPPSATTTPPNAALTLGSWTSVAKPSLPGTLYYVQRDSKLVIGVLSGGKLRSAPLRGTVGEMDCARQSLAVSPDGGSMAWVEGDNSNGNGGTALVIASLNGAGHKIVVEGNVACTGGTGPKWMPDSRRLIVRIDRGVFTVDTATGARTPAPPAWGGYLAWSADGRHVAYGESGKIVVATAAGKVVQRVPYDIDFTGGFSVQTVSTDGRYVGVSHENTDPGTVRGATRVVDMTTGVDIDLRRVAPALGEQQHIAEGRRLISTVRADGAKDVALDDPSGHQIASVSVPADAEILAYRP